MNRNIIYIVSVVLALFLGSQAFAVTLPSTSYQPLSTSYSAPTPSFTSSVSNLPMQSYSAPVSSGGYGCKAPEGADPEYCTNCCMPFVMDCVVAHGMQMAPECNTIAAECQSQCGGAASLPIPDAVPYLLALCAAYAAVLYAKKRKEQQA